MVVGKGNLRKPRLDGADETVRRRGERFKEQKATDEVACGACRKQGLLAR